MDEYLLGRNARAEANNIDVALEVQVMPLCLVSNVLNQETEALKITHG